MGGKMSAVETQSVFFASVFRAANWKVRAVNVGAAFSESKQRCQIHVMPGPTNIAPCHAVQLAAAWTTHKSLLCWLRRTRHFMEAHLV